MEKSDVKTKVSCRVDKDTYYLDIASAVCKRSTCLKRRYGCVIVKNDEIIATGYNGSPRGTTNCSDLGMCKRMDKPHNSGDYSDCYSVHAEQNAMLSASRNEMIGSTLYLVGEEKYIRGDFASLDIIHGEWAEIIDVQPCPICMRMIMNAGIAKVVTRKTGVSLI